MLFNLKDDPKENVNLATQDNDRTEKMTAQVNRYLATLPKPGPAATAQELDEQTKKALKSLGYVK